MHDSLGYVQHDPVHRAYHHGEMTFSLVYAWSENYVLPISHDEVVHGKGSLLRKMPGDRWRQLANLRAYLGFMWAHPGKQLLFMGAELGQESEWAEARELDWWLLDHPEHRGVHSLVRDLNAAYVASPALWQRDDDPGGFQWIDANDAGRNVFTFIRRAASGPDLVCVSNFAAVPHEGYRLGLPVGRARGTRCSTPTPRPTPARASATWAASTPSTATTSASRRTPTSSCRRWRRCGSASALGVSAASSGVTRRRSTDCAQRATLQHCRGSSDVGDRPVAPRAGVRRQLA